MMQTEIVQYNTARYAYMLFRFYVDYAILVAPSRARVAVKLFMTYWGKRYHILIAESTKCVYSDLRGREKECERNEVPAVT